jgi:hypothetical protein
LVHTAAAVAAVWTVALLKARFDMSIFFPDNDNRHDRLIQLSSDAQTFLQAAKSDYTTFRSLIAEINQEIAELYRRAGLTPPNVTTADIISAGAASSLVTTADTAVEVTNLIAGVAGLIATIGWLAPGAAAFLVETGAMEAETAATVLFTVLGTDVAIGTLAGGIIGGLIAGAVVVAVGLIVDAIEGAVLRDKLRDGIHKMDQIRAGCKLAQDKGTYLVQSLQAVKRTLDTLSSSNVPLNEQVIANLITKAAEPSIAQAHALTMATVVAELAALDRSRGSWTNEDVPPADTAVHPDYPSFVVAKVRSNARLAVPAGLKVTCLSDPNRLDSAPECPVVQVRGTTIWPLSYIDNRVAMALVAYNAAGNVVGQWSRNGARYIVDIAVDVTTGTLIFRGQAGQTVRLAWSDLAAAV